MSSVIEREAGVEGPDQRRSTWVSATAARVARAACGAHASCRVEIVPGDASPAMEGDGFHYTTPGGRSVYHPNAYRRAWGKPVYHGSTIRVEVGEEWVREQCQADITAEELAGIGGPRAARAAMEAIGPAEHAAWYVEEARLRRAVELTPSHDGYHRPPAIAWAEARRLVHIACDPATPRLDGWTVTSAQVAVALAHGTAAMDHAAHLASQPTDDAHRIERPYLLASSSHGLLIGDRRVDPRVVQVVVRDATTGYRHAISVPPIHGRVGCGHWRRLETDAARIHAAVAWTFAREPEQYQPQIEA